MSKLKARATLFDDPARPKLLTVRTVLSLLLVVAGIAWIAWYYTAVRVDPLEIGAKAGGPAWAADLAGWNYVIGFGVFFLGLIVAAHPSTPLGRGRGVVVGMLGCFVLGLLWICTFYTISNNIDAVPVFDDLGQYNLAVGIVFLGVGFTYATRWE